MPRGKAKPKVKEPKVEKVEEPKEEVIKVTDGNIVWDFSKTTHGDNFEELARNFTNSNNYKIL